MDAIIKGAMFDCRCFNIPKEEVTNCFYWRQLDASRNSIQMVGQANFSHRELQENGCIIDKEMPQELKEVLVYARIMPRTFAMDGEYNYETWDAVKERIKEV